jgi:hypothetical protein
MLLPFVAGQLLQPWIGSWVQTAGGGEERHQRSKGELVQLSAHSSPTYSQAVEIGR